jgi:hypothetical protein
VSHDHARHSQGLSADADQSKLAIALAQTIGSRRSRLRFGVLISSLAPLSNPGVEMTRPARVTARLGSEAEPRPDPPQISTRWPVALL